MQNEMPLLDKSPEMLLQRIPADACSLAHFTDAHAPMLARIVENLHGQLRQIGKDDLFPLDLRGKTLHLLL